MAGGWWKDKTRQIHFLVCDGCGHVVLGWPTQRKKIPGEWKAWHRSFEEVPIDCPNCGTRMRRTHWTFERQDIIERLGLGRVRIE